MTAAARTLLATALALAGLAAPARAAFFPAESIDGPSSDIVRLGDVDVSRDGGAAVVYLKRSDGVPHVWTARMTNGAWGAPEQLDVGQPGQSSDPHVAIADRGRAVASWLNDGALWAVTRDTEAAAWSAPVRVHPGPVQSSSLDLSVHGVGYAAFAVGGASRDVRAARMAGGAWTAFPDALDVDPAHDSGGGRGPQVAAATDGTGIVAWEEPGGDGRRRVYVRRVLRDRISAFPADASLTDLVGHAGGDARNPDVGLDDDTSHGWVMLEQSFDDGGIARSRVLARPIVGVGLEPPLVLDGLGFGTGEEARDPDLEVIGRERSLAVAEGPGATTVGVVLQRDVFGPIGRIDSEPSATAPDPIAAESTNGEGVFAWFEDPGGGVAPRVIGRFWTRDDELEPEAVLSNPDFGPAATGLGLDAASDRLNDTAVGFVQGGPLDRRIVVAHQDRALPAVSARSASGWTRDRRLRFSWRRPTEQWGEPQYRVETLGQQFASGTSRAFRPPFDLPEGTFTWHVVAIDRRGQETVGPERRVNVDVTAPLADVVPAALTVRAGGAIRVLTRDDPAPPPPPPAVVAPLPGVTVRTSGVANVSASFGDGARLRAVRELRHVYRRKGSYRLRIVVADRAGNRRIVKLMVRVTKAKKKKARK
ncbi:MAG TPA: hypothetical protein VF520_05395 [Thermoleophilaceae bacterium]